MGGIPQSRQAVATALYQDTALLGPPYMGDPYCIPLVIVMYCVFVVDILVRPTCMWVRSMMRVCRIVYVHSVDKPD